MIVPVSDVTSNNKEVGNYQLSKNNSSNDAYDVIISLSFIIIE
tara:strand:- start:471 stop:599 length:129 start_codon:yes stop_codon:yes gene_type:complete